MQSKKINVFLGGFINFTNAQNLNCLALARHLNKEKFEVYTLEIYSGNLESQRGKIPGVQIFYCFKSFRISGYLAFLWGIWHCDVAYLPKHELWKFNRLLLKLFNKKSFSTAEGILDEDNFKSAIEAVGSNQNVIDSYSFTDKKFPITKFVGRYNQERHQLKSENKVLYLGCDSALFKNDIQKNGTLSKVVYIGRLKKRKGVYDFLTLAKDFPEIDFLLFGNGEEKESIEMFCLENNIRNCKLLGTVSHSVLKKYLEEVDLHILPSRSEGFPKVTLETAAAGVPSIVYRDYGANEWITNGYNGWVVDSLQEMIHVMSNLMQNPEELAAISNNAKALAQEFDWNVRIKDWEIEILRVIDNE